MDNTTDKLCIYSYNSRGSSQEKLFYVQNLMDLTGSKTPIFCIQEHFLMRSSLRKLSSFFSGSSVIAKPAFKDTNVQNRGRPKGGLAIIVPKLFRKNIKIIHVESWRIQPILITVKNVKYLVVNVYFPTDSKTVHGECLELDDCLARLSVIISTTEFQHLHIAGDLNYEVGRNTNHSRKIEQFMAENKLISTWRKFNVDFTHCYENGNHDTFVHTIDHFLVLEHSEKVVVDAGVIHNVDNTSDHEPIYSVIEAPKLENKETIDEEEKGTPKFDWKNASDDQKLEFNDELFRRLMAIQIPDCVQNCRQLKCKDKGHTDQLDFYVRELLFSIIESGELTIPKVEPKGKNKVKKNTPGWKSFVEPYQDTAHFWHSIWTSCGRPINNEVHRIMKTTRNQYHYQIRRCRRVEEYIVNKNIIENCINSDTDLFSEIRKQRKEVEDDVTIDGASGKDIPGKFADVYCELNQTWKKCPKLKII